MTTNRLTTARDLGAHIRDLRHDATDAGCLVTDDWCRDRMRAHGCGRYEDVTESIIDAIGNDVDSLIADAAAEL